RGYKARALLAEVYLQQGNADRAETLWTTAITQEGEHLPDLSGLAEVYLSQKRWGEIEQVAARLDQLAKVRQSLMPEAPAGGVLRCRSLLAQQRFEEARLAVDHLVQRYPDRLEVLVLRSHIYLQEGKDLESAERALLALLERAPDHTEARSNLAVLRRQL